MEFITQSNLYVLLLTGLIPLLIGVIWYHPSLFGNRLNIDSNNLAGVLGSISRALFIYLFGVGMSYMIVVLTVHQFGPHLLFLGEPKMADPTYGAHGFLTNFMEQYGDRHRTFGHGIIHGTELVFLMSLALIGGTSLIEGRPMKKSWIHIGFWTLCGGLIGGVLAAYF